jgi:hypothetical protein
MIQVRKISPDLPSLADDYWGWGNMGGDALCLLAHFVIDILILLIIELDLFRSCRGYTAR